MLCQEHMSRRKIARELAASAIAENRPLEWFEELYSRSRREGVVVPWADFVPNSNAVEMLQSQNIEGGGRRALKIGSGLGDDSEYLAEIGFDVVGFDISQSAIQMTKERFPNSKVEYLVADLFMPPPSWKRNFDFVWESYTLQVLPPELREKAIANICSFVADDGLLLVVSRARDSSEPRGEMPWPLTRDELERFEEEGLECCQFDDYVDHETPPVRRFRALYRQQTLGLEHD